MYKSRLQELCQKKAWNLPEYNVSKQGQDHNPRFEATVIVNGMSFRSQNLTKSSKEAQNEAAHLAFLHFTSPPPPPPLPDHGSSSAIANRRMLQPEGQEAYRDCHVDEPASICKDNEKIKDMQHLYKNLLQNLAQKRNLGRPVYSCEFEGPAHASRFRCKVTINEKTYESLEFFPTIKEAEHAAARIALSSLAPDVIEEEDSSLYKNLLQELTQKEGCPLPVYKTTRSGEAHASMFVSAVEVKGEVFTGQGAKTKKQAELLAAKVAYMKLKECKLNRGSVTITSNQEREVPVLQSSILLSNVKAETQQNLGFEATSLLNSSSISRADQLEDRDIETLSSLHSSPDMTSDWQSESSSSYDHPLPEEDLWTSNSLSNHSAMTNSVEDLIELPVEMSTKSRSRVVVVPHKPNMKFPAGSTVLPFSDNNWVAFEPYLNQTSDFQ